MIVLFRHTLLVPLLHTHLSVTSRQLRRFCQRAEPLDSIQTGTPPCAETDIPYLQRNSRNIPIKCQKKCSSEACYCTYIFNCCLCENKVMRPQACCDCDFPWFIMSDEAPWLCIRVLHLLTPDNIIPFPLVSHFSYKTGHTNNLEDFLFIN